MRRRWPLPAAWINWLPFLAFWALLGSGWLLAHVAADRMVPRGSEYRMWPPLRDDLRALNLAGAEVGADVYTLSMGGNNEPLGALYVLRGVDSARLRFSAVWQARGVPERPPRERFFGHSRRARADDCPQHLVRAMLRRRGVESAVLTWREATPQGQRQARLTVWREVRGSIPHPFSARRQVCVESARTLPRR